MQAPLRLRALALGSPAVARGPSPGSRLPGRCPSSSRRRAESERSRCPQVTPHTSRPPASGEPAPRAEAK
ncbi:unnamed protein product [Bubo scandiacus]